jgi:hypothetical protein
MCAFENASYDLMCIADLAFNLLTISYIRQMSLSEVHAQIAWSAKELNALFERRTGVSFSEEANCRTYWKI